MDVATTLKEEWATGMRQWDYFTFDGDKLKQITFNFTQLETGVHFESEEPYIQMEIDELFYTCPFIKNIITPNTLIESIFDREMFFHNFNWHKFELGFYEIYLSHSYYK